jgi:hypothetical protein
LRGGACPRGWRRRGYVCMQHLSGCQTRVESDRAIVLARRRYAGLVAEGAAGAENGDVDRKVGPPLLNVVGIERNLDGLIRLLDGCDDRKIQDGARPDGRSCDRIGGAPRLPETFPGLYRVSFEQREVQRAAGGPV